ncbi:CFI-box-CTERM domain-containing protein [Methylocella silvestris]|uniref:Uncharacterized protein n=1 Tax=Methylocella silvestris TaxID=199596 RepID=A0A2J7TER6_METSI|nr:CFI-box-CTERM domain-containing protein [Methylocella silvestris]PNG25261.1 hypothetical protein CR492_13995 [Methylocella silvestris]
MISIRRKPACDIDWAGVFHASWRERWNRQINERRRALMAAYKLRAAHSGIDAHEGRGNCFIATELYGADALEVDMLRAYRDKVLLKNRGGRAFVAAYYRAVPTIIVAVRKLRLLRASLSACVGFSMVRRMYPAHGQ